MDNRHEVIRDAAMSAPPVSVAGLTLVGVSLQDWVLAATLFWIVVQTGWFFWSRIAEWKDKRDKRKI